MKSGIFSSKGLMAFALSAIFVVGMSAFKSEPNEFSKRARYSFYYTGPTTATQAEVEDPANWATTPPLSCNDVNERPCTIEVEEAYVNTGSTPTLKSTINLDADQDLIHNTYYVAGSADGSMVIENQSF